MLKWPVRWSRKIPSVTFVDGVRQSLDTSIDYLRRRQVGWLCDWQSTRERPSRQQSTLEATIRTTEKHLGLTSGERHWYLRWCCMGHCRRPLQLAGATTPVGQAWLTDDETRHSTVWKKLAEDWSLLVSRGCAAKLLRPRLNKYDVNKTLLHMFHFACNHDLSKPQSRSYYQSL